MHLNTLGSWLKIARTSVWQRIREPRHLLRAAISLFHDPIARRRLAIMLAAVLVCGYALGVLGYVVTMPEFGVRCVFSPVVLHVSPEFVYSPQGPPPPEDVLQENDRIVQLGDQPVQDWSQMLRETLDLRRETGVAVDPAALKDPRTPDHVSVNGEQLIRVRFTHPEDSKVHTAWMRVGQPRFEEVLPSFAWFWLKIGLFIVGAMVFWKRPEDRSAAQFFFLCMMSFGAYMGGFNWARILTQPVLLILFMVSSILLPAVSLHFYLVFPRPKQVLEKYPRAILLTVYGPPFLFFMLMLADYLNVRWINAHGGSSSGVGLLLDEMRFQILGYMVLAALWYLASVAALLHSWWTVTQPVERNQVKCILFGAGVALLPISYSLYVVLFESKRFSDGAVTWPMFAASLCMTAAYTRSITRYRLLRLDQLISSSVWYFLISSVVGLVYYGLAVTGMVMLGVQVSEGPSLGQVLGVSCTILVLLVSLDLIRGRFKAVLDRHFRRDKLQLDRTLQRMSQAIEQLVDPPTLGRRLLHTSADLLGVRSGAVYLRQGNPPLFQLADCLDEPPALVELSSGCPLVEGLQQGSVLVLSPRSLAPTPAQRQLQLLGGDVAQALQHEGQMLGLLLLGRKETGYSREDINLLTAFAQLTVLALVSAEEHRTIEALNRDLQAKVEKIAEQQRRILALQSQLMNRTPPVLLSESEPAEPAKPSSGPAPGVSLALPEGMVGSSPQIQGLMHLVRKVAPTSSVVLLRGESGTGKGLLARAIHEHSPRAGKPFVKVHCAALSQGLLESELFGHVKGAFTNAIRDKVGRFEAADGGTVFLDEIGDLSLEVQIKLLRVIQDRAFERVGSSEPTEVDVRIIAATHRDLEALMHQGRFREDLFFRLNVFPIGLPPLRVRVEDVPELTMHFLRLHGQQAGKRITDIEDDALARLKAFYWPGNIRQLENVIQRAVVVAEKSCITLADLPAELLLDTPLPADFSLAPRPSDYFHADGRDSLREPASTWSPLLAPSSAATGITSLSSEPPSAIQLERAERDRREREQLVRALAAAGGNKARAARALGLKRSTLVSRLKRLGLS
jgi:transcriptional regulator with GAF, ATPase, and Fis domain